MKKFPKVSIIIPLYVICDRFFSDLRYFEKLKYPNFELLIVSDKKIDIPPLKNVNAKLILTKRRHTGPAEKRDIALKYAKGEICAFIDDDAYPDANWISNAVKNFQKKEIVAVGGSGITPKEDSYFAKLGGSVYESVLVSGGFRERFKVMPKRKKVKDWPAYNFFALTKILKGVKGWGSNFYGGEDTLLCLKLLKVGTIIYDPKVVVYHHRRSLYKSHLKQIYNVSIHRGYFARVFPQTSRLAVYFVPTLLDVYFIVLVILSLFSFVIEVGFLTQIFLAFLIAYFSVYKSAGLIGSIFAAVGVLLTHFCYGIGFVKGYFTKKLLR